MVVLPDLDDNERSALVQEKLDNSWRELAATYPELERPNEKIVRFVMPNEWGEARERCLAEAGIDAKVSADGGVEFTGVTDQAQFFDLANYVCEARYPLDPVALVPLNESQLEYTYWYFTEELIPCLAQVGVEVESVPSLVVFKETFYTSDHWSPYGSVPESVDWEMVNAECPQSGPALYGAR